MDRKSPRHVGSANVLRGFGDDDLRLAWSTHGDTIKNNAQGLVNALSMSDLVDSDDISVMAVEDLLKNAGDYLPTTGIVMAGFGNRDYFPKMYEYHCYGAFLGNVLFEGRDHHAITTNETSAIVGFAFTDMVDMFTRGANAEIFKYVSDAFRESLAEFTASIKDALNVPEIPGTEERIENAKREFDRRWYVPCISAHWEPLKRVVGLLPVEEMADLAETLINLESLKEKVTRPTASIGGPVDVATIAKYEGFVWIKRKHYFTKELNPRYFARKYG
jgi:hypothetical protein